MQKNRDVWMRRVEAATVSLPAVGGQGVLVPGGFVLTATHCIRWSGTGEIVLGDVYPQEVLTKNEAKFRLGLEFCDPVSDIAVLGELDNQVFDRDCDAFEEWREQVTPIELSIENYPLYEPHPVFILSHKNEWLTGKVSRWGPPNRAPEHSLMIKAEEAIEGGTSGGPVVTPHGRLLGIVSNISSGSSGSVPVAHRALPRWVLDHITGKHERRIGWKKPRRR